MRTRRRMSAILGLALGLLLSGCSQASNPPKYDPDLIFGYDKTLPLSPQETPAEETADYRVIKVTYRSARDQRVPALLILPKQPREERLPCVILMHGLGGDKRMFQMLWGHADASRLRAVRHRRAVSRASASPATTSRFSGCIPTAPADALIQTGDRPAPGGGLPADAQGHRP